MQIVDDGKSIVRHELLHALLAECGGFPVRGIGFNRTEGQVVYDTPMLPHELAAQLRAAPRTTLDALMHILAINSVGYFAEPAPCRGYDLAQIQTWQHAYPTRAPVSWPRLHAAALTGMRRWAAQSPVVSQAIEHWAVSLSRHRTKAILRAEWLDMVEGFTSTTGGLYFPTPHYVVPRQGDLS